MTRKQLDRILADHAAWRADATKGIRADLRGADLRGADLRGADLRGADLYNTDLRGANLTNADLANANLTNADLTGVILDSVSLRDADLTGANLTGADLDGADLTGANLTGADLDGVDQTGANLTGTLEIPVVVNLDQAIAFAVGAAGENLKMSDWHCGTQHCRAGWAITLAGPAGAELEDEIGPATAGALIYWCSAGYIPDFYAETEIALADIKARAIS